jgi:NhaA family Na+:H+ antiporter
MRLESAGGLLLIAAALLAMIVANSPAAAYYDLFLNLPVEVRVGSLLIAKPLILWINDGLMAVFFFLVGLELKREVVEGELSRLENVMLPLAGAFGGIVVPVAIYVAINYGDAVAMTGWAIPAATDIAFALGVLVLFGKRVPLSLKVFLVSIAIFDDIAAIVIIAIFYSGDLSITALAVAVACLAILTLMNRRGVVDTSPYLWVGLIMWTALLKSGVHATLAGVALAVFIPMVAPNEPGRSPLKTLENDLHHLVAFVILPIFAFANAGISVGGMGMDDFLHPVSVGIAIGLFLGKQLGVFSFCWIVLKMGIAKMPSGANFGSIYGISVLCGIGFTMSMFIGSLAFERDPTNAHMIFDERLGIIAGSLASAVLAWLVLNRYLPKTAIDES